MKTILIVIATMLAIWFIGWEINGGWWNGTTAPWTGY